MKIQKTAKSMIISGSPAEMKKLAAKNPKIAQMVNDAQLPGFLDKVDQMYRDTFNVPGGLPDGLRMELTRSVRNALKNQMPTNNGPSILPEDDDFEDVAGDALKADPVTDEIRDEGTIDNPMSLSGDPSEDLSLKPKQFPFNDRLSNPDNDYLRSERQRLADDPDYSFLKDLRPEDEKPQSSENEYSPMRRRF